MHTSYLDTSLFLKITFLISFFFVYLMRFKTQKMKQILSVIAIFFSSTFTYAQPQKGNLILALDGSYSYSNLQTVKSSNLQLNSAAYKLVTKKLGVGISVVTDFSRARSRNPLNQEINESIYTNSIAIGPAFRTFLGKSKFKPYGEVRVGWEFWKGSIPRGKYHNNNINSFYIRPLVGFGYWISNTFSVDINTCYDYDPTDRSHNWFTNLGFNINLGHMPRNH